LVFVVGFDVPLGDVGRRQACLTSFDAVSRAVGATAVVVETNLREHPFFDSVNWERTHGGALAALGHLLSGRIGTLVVPATLNDDFQPPWGSHPRTDPLWSSETLAIEQHGTTLWRHEKLWRIQDESLVQAHLRVCWENLAPTGNCSRCDKCLITMMALRATGRLDRFTVFDPPRSLSDALDALPRTRFLRTIGLLLDADLPDDEKRALGRLRERTAGA
jgi:hypothetical protein